MFFAKIRSSNTPKNKLQTQILEQLGQLECITVTDPDAFKAHLQEVVKQANAKHHRCTALEAKMQLIHGQKHYRAAVDGLIEIHLYFLYGEFNPSAIGCFASLGVQARIA